jgi:glycosyltransferase involved in cell wall biosynthesis
MTLSEGPLFSVCIRAHRGGRMLRRAITSAITQTEDDLEVVVCDDRGASATVASGFADPRVRYVRNALRPGPAGNLAAAIGAARGGFVAVLNEDDTLEPGFLAAASSVLLADETVGVVFAPVTWEVGNRTMRVQSHMAAGRHADPLCDYLQHGLPAVAIAVRRAAFTQSELRVPLQDGMVGDFMLCARIARDGWAFHGLADPYGRITIHGDQLGWRADYFTRLHASLEALSLDDVPEAERLRLARLSECHAAFARVALRRGRPLEALQEVRSAARTSPGRLGVRHLMAALGLWQAGFRVLSAHPRTLVALWRLWGRVRPSV